ncbi:hypothetical protein Pan216_10660 [Planctomycetes bacterium Pan216]|uniref:Uncharacterized protein n=1 Tax=Kolteria novifilia TaxID=2527975 RepID=A0A518AZQ6_9BACT|nr:hypothetical protein Pan216_10660 [Planctomycetes bacterium Pan216]
MANYPKFEPMPPLKPLPNLQPMTKFGNNATRGIRKIIATMYDDVPPAMKKQLDWCNQQLDQVEAKLPGAMENAVAEIQKTYENAEVLREKLNNAPKLIEEAKKKHDSSMKAARKKMERFKLPLLPPEEVETWHDRVRDEVLRHFYHAPAEGEPHVRTHQDFRDWAMSTDMMDLYESAEAMGKPPQSVQPAKERRVDWKQFLDAHDAHLGHTEATGAQEKTPPATEKPSRTTEDRDSYSSWLDWLSVSSGGEESK